VVIDGLDGSGKSTQAKLLCRRLSLLGLSYVLRTHPAEDNFFGRLGRKYLKIEGKSARVAASLFYMIDVIRSIVLYRWRKLDFILFVRYLMGTAYLPAPLHKLAYLFFYVVVPIGDCMIFLDVTPEEALRRIESRSEGKSEVFESMEKLFEVRKKARDLVSFGGWRSLNGDHPPSLLHHEILDFLELKVKD
jgi:dTMP kinase